MLIGYDSGKEQKDGDPLRLDGGRDHPEPDRHRRLRRRFGRQGAQGREVAEDIDTGFYWYDKTNIDDPKIAAVLYD